MTPPEMLAIFLISAVDLVSVMANPLYVMFSDCKRQAVMPYVSPGAIVMSRAVPVITLKEVVHTRNQDDVIGRIDADVIPDVRGGEEKRWCLEYDRRRRHVDVDARFG